MVTPPALMAATPVGATTAIFLKLCALMYFKKVVLPVPALPVKNRCLLVWLTKETAWLKMVFDVKDKLIMQRRQFKGKSSKAKRKRGKGGKETRNKGQVRRLVDGSNTEIPYHSMKKGIIPFINGN